MQTQEFKEASELAKELKEIAKETKSNHQKCKTLAERTEIIVKSLEGADPQRKLISHLNDIFKRAQRLLESNDNKHFLVHALQHNTALVEFQNIHYELYKYALLLNLKTPEAKCFDEQQDAKDEEQDKNSLKELYNLYITNHEKLQSVLDVQIEKIPQDKAIASIKTQLQKLNAGKHVEVSPSELRLIQKIGAGSYGEVWKASWHGNPVAVKMVLSHDLHDGLVQDFREELEKLCQLNHPHVARLYGASTLNKEQLALVFEFYPNNLYKLVHVDKHTLHLPAKLKLAVGIARGLDYLHQKKLLHRDLKSANILLDAEKNPKISDVGMTKVKSQSSRTKLPSAWMGPELFQMKPHLYLQLDVYSFGIILWELITEQFPFHEYKDPTQIALAVKNGERPLIPDDFPAELAPIVKSCWEAEPDKRPPIAEVLKTLEHIEETHQAKAAEAESKKKKKKDKSKEPHNEHTKEETHKEPAKEAPKKEESHKPAENPTETKSVEKEPTKEVRKEAPKEEKKEETTKEETKPADTKTTEKEGEKPKKKKKPKTEAAQEETPNSNNQSTTKEEPTTESTKKDGGKASKTDKSSAPKEKKQGGCCVVM